MNVLRMITLYRMCEIGELTRECGAATPGIAKLYVADVDDIVSIPTANLLLHTIIGNIIMKPGKFFKDIPFVEQKAGLSDELADAVGGGFKKNIPLKIPKYSPQTNRWIQQAIGARFIAIVIDNNSQMIIVGNKFVSMRLEKATGTTGQKTGDENGWDMNLTAEDVKPCYFYTGTVVLQDAVQAYDTTIDFTEDGSVSVEGVTAAINNTHTPNLVQQLTFDKITDAIGLPSDMTLTLGGVTVCIIIFKAEYATKPFTYKHANGTDYPLNFTAGDTAL